MLVVGCWLFKERCKFSRRLTTVRLAFFTLDAHRCKDSFRVAVKTKQKRRLFSFIIFIFPIFVTKVAKHYLFFKMLCVIFVFLIELSNLQQPQVVL